MTTIPLLKGLDTRGNVQFTGTEKDRLLRLYWFCDASGINSSDDPYRKRQMDASVVMARRPTE